MPACVSEVKLLSRVRIFVIPGSAAYQPSLSMDFPGKSTGVGCMYSWLNIYKKFNHKII